MRYVTIGRIYAASLPAGYDSSLDRDQPGEGRTGDYVHKDKRNDGRRGTPEVEKDIHGGCDDAEEEADHPHPECYW